MEGGYIMKMKQFNVIMSLVLIMFMSAIETTIVSIALPTMRHDLRPDVSIAFVFTVYFIGIVVAIPLISELMSRIEIRVITLLGLSLFIGGSLLAGFSHTFDMLLLSRFIQGIGAGINMSLAQIVPKLAFAIPFRYKVMGIVGSVWGISSIIGPFIGGFILEWTTWHWLFFINVPIGAIAFILVIISYRFEAETTEKHVVDYRGILLFYIFIGCLMWTVMTYQMNLLYVGALLLLIFFSIGLIHYYKKKPHAFISIKEFTPKIRLAFITDIMIAAILIGFNVFIPSYLQDEFHYSPLQSGLIIFPLSVGWLLINFTLDYIEQYVSIKTFYVTLLIFLFLASVSVSLNVNHPILIAITVFFAGMGFGSAFTKDSVLVQEGVSQGQMKKMMSLFTLNRNLGNAMGSAIMGTVYSMSVAFLNVPIQHVMALAMLLLSVLWVIWQQHKTI